jgi:hypothetical protein
VLQERGRWVVVVVGLGMMVRVRAWASTWVGTWTFGVVAVGGVVAVVVVAVAARIGMEQVQVHD